MDNEREHIEKMLEILNRQRQLLEEKIAMFGLQASTHDKIALEDTYADIAKQQARLAQLAGPSSQSIPDNLPRSSQVFVGRKAEIARCLEALSPDERGWGVVIDGIGGMGKTALALEVAAAARTSSMFDAYLFVSAKTSWMTSDGVREETLALSSLDAFVREFARQLGFRDIVQIPDAKERRRALLDALRGRRALLIWDNLETLIAEERDMIAEFLRKLPGQNKAIVTSRRRTGESAATIRLDRLSEIEAFALMDAIARNQLRVRDELKRTNAATHRALYEAAGGNPLVLHITLGLVAQKSYSLDRALDHLRDPSRAADLYGFLFADAARDLQQNDRTVLSALVTFRTAASLAALTDATKLRRNLVELALERLVALSLVNDVDDGYGLHPLTRTYVNAALGVAGAAAQAATSGVTLDPQARRAALRYWVDYAKQYGGSHKDAYQTFDLLEAAWPNLESTANDLRELAGIPGALRDQEAARMLNDLTDALGDFLQFRGYWEERIRLSEWSYEAIKALGNWHAAGWRAYSVAFIHHSRAATDQAAIWAGHMTEAMERSGDRRDRAVATRMRGLIAEQRGNLAEAERCYMEALTTYRDLADEAAWSSALSDLGRVVRRRKDHDRAEMYYKQALALAEKIGNQEYQANYCASLGLLALDRNCSSDARPWFERGLTLALIVGRQDLIAATQSGLAQVLEAEQQYAASLRYAEQALQISERLRDGSLDFSLQLVARLRAKVGG